MRNTERLENRMSAQPKNFQHLSTIRGASSEITAIRWVENGLFFLLRDGRAYVAPLSDEDSAPLLRVSSDYISHAAWSSEGIFLATASRMCVEIYDVLSKESVLVLPIRGIRMPSRVAWSLFDRYLAVAAWSIRVFDTANGEEVVSFPSHVAGICDMVWSPDARYIATADGWGFVRLSDLHTGNVEELTNIKSNGWRKLAWSPCGQFLMMDSANDGGEGGMEVFDLSRRLIVARLPHRGVRFCCFQTLGIHPPPDGEGVFLTKCGKEIRLWRTRDWELIAKVAAEGSNYIWVLCS